MVWHRLTRIPKVELVASGIIFLLMFKILVIAHAHAVAMGMYTLHTRKERCIVQEVQKLDHRWRPAMYRLCILRAKASK